MKIIAKTEIGFILEASKTEIANLIGFYSEYSGEKANVPIGSEIKVNEMYHQLYKIKEIRNQVKKIVEAGSELVECVRVKMPVIEPIISAVEAHIEKS